MLVFQIILEFFKAGLFAIGGGLATIPFLYEMAYKYNWFTVQTLTMMIAVSESTPGPMGVNMATYVGTHLLGVGGGILATLSLVTPSVIIICLVARVLTKFKESKLVQSIFTGLRPATVALILAACSGIFINALFINGFTFDLNGLNWLNVVLYAILLGIYFWKKPHPILVILGSAVIGILLSV